MALTKKSYNKMFKNYPDVVSAKDVAEMVGIGLKKAYRLLIPNKNDWLVEMRTDFQKRLNFPKYCAILIIQQQTFYQDFIIARRLNYNENEIKSAL